MRVGLPWRGARDLLARGVLAGSALAFGACAVIAPPAAVPIGAIAAPRMSGRLAVQMAQDPQRSFSAGFELVGNALTGELVLTTPIGTRLAQARWTPSEVLLETPEGSRFFPDLDALAVEVFREAIPLAALIDWLGGRPWPGAGAEVLAAPEAGFSQLGWKVSLDRHADGLVVAQRAVPSAVAVRARIDRP